MSRAVSLSSGHGVRFSAIQEQRKSSRPDSRRGLRPLTVIIPGQGLCDPANGKMPKELMAKLPGCRKHFEHPAQAREHLSLRYLASLSSWDLMSGPLSWCYKLKDVLVKCDPVKPARGCVNIILPSFLAADVQHGGRHCVDLACLRPPCTGGVKEMVVPKLDKNDKWLEQAPARLLGNVGTPQSSCSGRPGSGPASIHHACSSVRSLHLRLLAMLLRK